MTSVIERPCCRSSLSSLAGSSRVGSIGDRPLGSSKRRRPSRRGDLVRILQVAPYLPPYPGGQERHVASLSAKLAERGHEVRVLTSDHPPSSDSPGFGVEVRRMRSLGRPLRNPITPSSLTARESYRWADVIHVHNEHAFPSVVASFAARDRPRVLTCHGDLRFGRALPDAFERAYTRTIGRAVMRSVDRVIGLSASERERLIGLGVPTGRVTVVPNAIDAREPASIQQARAWREKRGHGERPVVVFLGPLLARKRPDALVLAWPKIVASLPEARAVFLGDGEAKARCERLAARLGVADELTFLGHVSDSERDAALAAADALAFPSMSEGFPGAIIEAALTGTPIVANDLPALRDWFGDLVALADQERFADALVETLLHPETARARAKAARERAHAFTWTAVLPRIERIYEEVAR